MVENQTWGPSVTRRMRWGSLHRLCPISRKFGFDRGSALDRYYIEKFLGAHRADISGHVLEIGDDHYTRRFGENRVTRSDVLNVERISPQTTIVADLTRADHIPSDTFDCIIFTQTLQCIYDAPAAIRTLHRILTPGGVLLATTHGISYLCDYDWERWGEYWRFTSVSARRLFEEVFPSRGVEVNAYGNILVATAFLHGLAIKELTEDELEYRDPAYEVLITIRAIKPT